MSSKEQLKEILDKAEWSWIRPHLARDAVILVSTGLELLEVGVQVANNQVAQIEKWIQGGQLRKPSLQEISAWEGLQTKKFLCLVIQPYVLIQELEMIH